MISQSNIQFPDNKITESQNSTNLNKSKNKKGILQIILLIIFFIILTLFLLKITNVFDIVQYVQHIVSKHEIKDDSEKHDDISETMEFSYEDELIKISKLADENGNYEVNSFGSSKDQSVICDNFICEVVYKGKKYTHDCRE